MEGYQKLTKNGLKMAFFSMLKPVIDADILEDDQKMIVVKSIQMAYCSLRSIDDDIADALNDRAEDEMLMALTNMLIPEPEDIVELMEDE